MFDGEDEHSMDLHELKQKVPSPASLDPSRLHAYNVVGSLLPVSG